MVPVSKSAASFLWRATSWSAVDTCWCRVHSAANICWLPRPLCCEWALVAALFLLLCISIQAAAVYITVWACLGASSPEFEEGTGAALFRSAVYSFCACHKGKCLIPCIRWLGFSVWAADLVNIALLCGLILRCWYPYPKSAVRPFS